MKTLILILSLTFTIGCFAQLDEVERLVEIGIEHHDNEEYAEAIEIYNQALAIAPESDLVHYEMALTYMYMGENQKAIQHSDVVIEMNNELLLPAYVTKGSALSNLGQTEEALSVFEEAVNQFGENNLLNFNIGISYAKVGENKKAEEALIRAVYNDPNHSSSHYALAIIKNEQGERVPSLLSAYYFLLLEPVSARSENIFEILQSNLSSNVQADENNPNQFTINFNASDSEFSAVELMLSLAEASNLRDKTKSSEELFIDTTKSFFSTLKEQKEKNEYSNIWWDFYIPFYADLYQSDFMEVFCGYISLSQNENGAEWVQRKEYELIYFGDWLQGE